MRYVILLAVALTACGKEKPAEPVVTSDSSGVHIVTSRVAAWTPATAWTVVGQPTLQIGGGVADTSALVGPVAGAFRLADGRVVVGDRGGHAVRWFSGNGTPLLTVGGEGELPGEFRDLDGVLEIGDSIAIFDAQLHRLSIFGPEGKFVRFIGLAGKDNDDPFGLRPIGRISTGRWIALAKTRHTTGEMSGPRRDSTWIWMVGQDGQADTLIASLSGDDVLIASGDGFLGVMPAPFGRRTTVRAHDGAIWVGTGDSYRIDALDLQGRLITSIRLDQRPAIIEAAGAKASVDSLRHGRQSGPMAELISRAYDEALSKLELPEFKPPYSTFRIADDSTIWVERFVTENSTSPTKWDVFSPEGHWLGIITLPPRFTPTQISRTELLGIWKDPDGVDHVVAYRLERGMTS